MDNKLFLQSTATAQWHALVGEAQTVCAVSLDESLESYLVFLLIRFMEQPEIAASVLGLEFLEAQHHTGYLRQQNLRDVGDKCLLFSGFFPGAAESRRVTQRYFVDVGQGAYGVLADEEHADARLFAQLSQAFVPLRDLLQAMRELDGSDTLTPLQALDMYQGTGSGQALTALRRVTQGQLVMGSGVVN